jgi:hypothetical protein
MKQITSVEEDLINDISAEFEVFQSRDCVLPYIVELYDKTPLEYIVYMSKG